MGRFVTSGHSRYLLDPSVRRFGTTIVGGSPLTVFRVTESGRDLVERLAAGEAVGRSPLVDRLLDTGAAHPLPGDTTLTVADVTVVVPVFGQAPDAPPGSVVVDDGSSPPIQGATIRLERNAGPAAARNAGMATVTTPLVAFVDADVSLPDGWLDGLLPHFADPAVGAVAPRIRSAVGAGALARYERGHSPLDLGDEPARIRAGSRVSYVPAAVLVCRTAAVDEIGGFDTDLRFGEDVDLVWRLDDAGWVCRYEPSIVAEHAPRSDWGGWVRQRVGYGSSAAPLARRHRGRLAPLRMNGWSLASWLLAAFGHPLLAGAVGAGSAAALVPKLPDIPGAEAFRLAAEGNVRAGDQIARAIRRAWLPIVALAAVRSRAARTVLVASVLAGRHPLVVADDAAYCAGVWRGMLSERTIDPIVPDIVSWPGGRRRSRRRAHYGPSA
jgi:mycofactocin system glycosyltransferase